MHLRSLLDLFLVLEYVAFRNRPAASSFVLLLSSFLNNFKDTLHIMLRSAKFLANSFLGNPFAGANILLYAYKTVIFGNKLCVFVTGY